MRLLTTLLLTLFIINTSTAQIRGLRLAGNNKYASGDEIRKLHELEHTILK